jgi:transposase
VGWLERAYASQLSSFAAGLRRDWAAVKAAFSSPWSQGQVEGQINRLKMLKRQMYGRASFALLRSRTLFIDEQPRIAQSVAA